MSEKKCKILAPLYLQSFKCTGSQCEDTCCQGWTVYVNYDTYRKYQKIYDPELKQILAKSVARNRTTRDTRMYAKIKLAENGFCPLMNKENLCSLQLKKGESYLSDTCSVYPRITNVVDGVYERSATMSCPEAARIALLNPKPLEFEQTEQIADYRNTVSIRFDTQNEAFLNKPQRFFWNLRTFSISLLQNRNYELWERLTLLGLFFGKAQEYSDNGKTDQIPNLVETFTTLVNEGTLKESMKSIPVQDTLQMKLLKEISDRRLLRNVSSKRYLECYAEFLQGIGCLKSISVEEMGHHYYTAYEEYYKPFMAQHSYILENYLVNHVFKVVFPFSGEKTLFNEYVALVLHYSLVKMLLIGMSGYHKKMDFDLVIKLMESFSRAIEHNPIFLTQIYDLVSTNGYNTMPYMSILIKN